MKKSVDDFIKEELKPVDESFQVKPELFQYLKQLAPKYLALFHKYLFLRVFVAKNTITNLKTRLESLKFVDCCLCLTKTRCDTVIFFSVNFHTDRPPFWNVAIRVFALLPVLKSRFPLHLQILVFVH